MHPAHHLARQQSLAHATVPPGTRTLYHRHQTSEEIYHFLAGRGTMRWDGRTWPVTAGDTVVIPPGTAHGLINDSDDDLVLLCACSPAYHDEDTVAVDE